MSSSRPRRGSTTPPQAKWDAGYDGRLVRMLRAVRPLIVQTRSMEPSRRRSTRPQPSENPRYRIDETLAAPEPGVVVVAVDDLLTSGARFRAAKRVLTRRFPDIEMVGLFLARRVPKRRRRTLCLTHE